jgi:hypothetical protein
MTNFLNPSTTLGTTTGDLKGAVSATLLGAPQSGPGGTVVFHVQHHWVTEGGDTLTIDPAAATTVPLSQTLFCGGHLSRAYLRRHRPVQRRYRGPYEHRRGGPQ